MAKLTETQWRALKYASTVETFETWRRGYKTLSKLCGMGLLSYVAVGEWRITDAGRVKLDAAPASLKETWAHVEAYDKRVEAYANRAASEAQQAASTPDDSGQGERKPTLAQQADAVADGRMAYDPLIVAVENLALASAEQDAEIKRLRERVDELEGVLTPFATLYKEYLTETEPTDGDDPPQFEEWLIEKLDDGVFAELFTEAFAFARSALDAART